MSGDLSKRIHATEIEGMTMGTQSGIALKARIAIAALLALFCLGLAAQPALADFGIVRFDGEATDISGNPLTQAGAHPDVSTEFDFSTLDSGEGLEVDGSAKHVLTDLPTGLVGNPQVVDECPEARLLSHPIFGSYLGSCPNDSIVGVAYVTTTTGMLIVPVAKLAPPPGAAAQFGFNVSGVINKVKVFSEDGGRKLVADAEIPQGVAIVGTKLVFWGVPADEAHDALRGGDIGGGVGVCGDGGLSPCESHLPERPFMSSPTDCAAGPLTVRARANSWQRPDVFSAASFLTHLPDGTPTGVTDCELLRFEPTLSVLPTEHAAGVPTGLEVELKLPQDENPDAYATAHLKSTSVLLPEGMTVNAATAEGLKACSPAQIGLGTNNPVSCPTGSKIGTVEIETPLLKEPLEGSVYIAEQGNNPFNSLLAMYVVAASPERGVLVKLAGKVTPDPVTGQLRTSFDDNPQLPFERLRLKLSGGPTAALVTPDRCGTYSVRSQLRSWARPNSPLSSDSTFVIDQGCGSSSQFTPGFEAGTTNPTGGSFSPFTLRVTRSDAQQNVSRIETTLPEGVLAKLAGVPLCGDAQAPTGNCPAASQVGSAIVGAGAGSNPLYVPQPGKAPTAVYLAGPYKGAPYSLVAKVPAQAGPFDLGTVAVRNTVEVNPVTAQVSVASDPLPQILQGIPVAYRDIRVSVDRPQFTINPTSCDPKQIEGVITSIAAKAAHVSDRFQAASCERLAFKPKLAISLSGKTNRSAHPALKATLTMPGGGANIARAQVILPKTELLENAHIKTICTRVQFAADKCPAQSVYGHAKAWSPLLEEPIQGPVYLRSSNHELPDLVASLDGQIQIDLQGRIDSVNERIRNTFDLVPDAPVSKFVLTMQGGKKGLLANNTDLCKARPRADISFMAQNGKSSDSRPLVKAQCGKGRKARK